MTKIIEKYSDYNLLFNFDDYFIYNYWKKS